MRKVSNPRDCAVCGERVKRDNGFFPSYPVPLSLHHGCLRAYGETLR